jgi:hypothetical protein
MSFGFVQRATLQGRETRDIFRYVDDYRDAFAEPGEGCWGLAPGAVSSSVAAKIY